MNNNTFWTSGYEIDSLYCIEEYHKNNAKVQIVKNNLRV